MKASKILTILFVVALTFAAANVFAGPPPPPPGGGSGPGGGSSSPIDGGSLALLAGTAAYGYRHLKRLRIED